VPCADAGAYICRSNRSKSTIPAQKTLLFTLVVLNARSGIGNLLRCKWFIGRQKQACNPAFCLQFCHQYDASVLIASCGLKKYMWGVPVLFLDVANINLTVLASIDLVFDYGFFGMYLK